MPAGKDYREALTAKLIEQLEAGTAPWQQPWESRSRLPYNATTDKAYRGVNSLYLTAISMERNYTDPRWATYRQASEHGWQVRKGEKGVGIEYWKRTDSQAVRDAQGNPVRDKGGKALTREVELPRPRVFYATVFNLEQMDGAPERSATQRSYAWDPLERAEGILQSSGARIIHDQRDAAFYKPSADEIHMPTREQFKNAAAYYGTALHELGHWSGHESRLKRDLSGAFGSESYAKEELRAELSSYFTSDQLGVPHDTNRHASYVKSWIKALADDKNEIFRASRDAEQITEYVIGLDLNRQAARANRLDGRPALSDANIQQAAGLQPQGTERPVDDRGHGDRALLGEEERTASPGAETTRLTPRFARAAAFEQLPELEAIARHPELRSVYDGWRNMQEALAARFPADANSREKYSTAARAAILKQLDAGQLLEARSIMTAIEGRDTAPRTLPFDTSLTSSDHGH